MSQSNKQLEEDTPKDEDWEVVSGSKSLTIAAAEYEQSSKDAGTEKTVTGETSEREDDWYKTIPATPANTPEYTPLPPSYPSAGYQRSVESSELPPITEDVAEEPPPKTVNPPIAEEDSSSESLFEDTMFDPDSIKSLLKAAWPVLYRFILSIVMIKILKWSVTKIIEKCRRSRAQTEAI